MWLRQVSSDGASTIKTVILNPRTDDGDAEWGDQRRVGVYQGCNVVGRLKKGRPKSVHHVGGVILREFG